jgi:hypothetical protein
MSACAIYFALYIKLNLLWIPTKRSGKYFWAECEHAYWHLIQHVISLFLILRFTKTNTEYSWIWGCWFNTIYILYNCTLTQNIHLSYSLRSWWSVTQWQLGVFRAVSLKHRIKPCFASYRFLSCEINILIYFHYY